MAFPPHVIPRPAAAAYEAAAWATIEAKDAELAERWSNGVRERYGRVF